MAERRATRRGASRLTPYRQLAPTVDGKCPLDPRQSSAHFPPSSAGTPHVEWRTFPTKLRRGPLTSTAHFPPRFAGTPQLEWALSTRPAATPQLEWALSTRARASERRCKVPTRRGGGRTVCPLDVLADPLTHRPGASAGQADLIGLVSRLGDDASAEHLLDDRATDVAGLLDVLVVVAHGRVVGHRCRRSCVVAAPRPKTPAAHASGHLTTSRRRARGGERLTDGARATGVPGIGAGRHCVGPRGP